MERLQFDSQGKFIGLKEEGTPIVTKKRLLRSRDLVFLEDDDLESKDATSKLADIHAETFWDLRNEKGFIEPLKFSNGKTQKDVVKEIVDLAKNGTKVIFLHGVCGSGKSAIALNVARLLGKSSVVVPVKALQKQYEQDYMHTLFLNSSRGKKLRIAVMTGRDNHDSVFRPGLSCADSGLPENIRIVEKHYSELLNFHKGNPYITSHDTLPLKNIKRLSIAPANPYWSPILPADFPLTQFIDARQYTYTGVDGRTYIFYHRKQGCSYYDQYLAYVRADVIIFNAAKYLAEMALGRKPQTEIDIIDEADEFLDGLFRQSEINVTKFADSLKMLFVDDEDAQSTVKDILYLLELEEKQKRALGIDENQIFPIGETKFKEIFSLLLSNDALEAEIIVDDSHYVATVFEKAQRFIDFVDDLFITYQKDGDDLIMKLVSVNLSAQMKDLLDKTKVLLFMSGTLHSEKILKKIFGIEDYAVVEAEHSHFGSVEIVRTGKEIDCRYSNFQSGRHSREEYLEALQACIATAKRPSLIHVHAFADLPDSIEKQHLDLSLIESEELRNKQRQDVGGTRVQQFKTGNVDVLFSTACSRGMDFPGDMCRSIIFTKYPNPSVRDTFWKILQHQYPSLYWDMYKDKARREFLQRLYRGLRSKDDHVYVLSPDIRVLSVVQELQRNLYTQ